MALTSKKNIILLALNYYCDAMYADANDIHVDGEDMSDEEKELRELVASARIAYNDVRDHMIELPETPLTVRHNAAPYVIESEDVFDEHRGWFQWEAEGVNWEDYSSNYLEIDLDQFDYDDCPYPEFVQTCKVLHEAGLEWVLVVNA